MLMLKAKTRIWFERFKNFLDWQTCNSAWKIALKLNIMFSSQSYPSIIKNMFYNAQISWHFPSRSSSECNIRPNGILPPFTTLQLSSQMNQVSKRPGLLLLLTLKHKLLILSLCEWFLFHYYAQNF